MLAIQYTNFYSNGFENETTCFRVLAFRFVHVLLFLFVSKKHVLMNPEGVLL